MASTGIDHIVQLQRMAGGTVTEAQACWLRAELVSAGLLDWRSDQLGGVLTATHEQWNDAVANMHAWCASIDTDEQVTL